MGCIGLPVHHSSLGGSTNTSLACGTIYIPFFTFVIMTPCVCSTTRHVGAKAGGYLCCLRGLRVFGVWDKAEHVGDGLGFRWRGFVAQGARGWHGAVGGRLQGVSGPGIVWALLRALLGQMGHWGAPATPSVVSQHTKLVLYSWHWAPVRV